MFYGKRALLCLQKILREENGVSSEKISFVLSMKKDSKPLALTVCLFNVRAGVISVTKDTLMREAIMKEKGSNKMIFFLIGSMLFGMFFGAGNLIFPIQLGQEAGANMIPATLGFLITATGLPFLGVVAMGLANSDSLLDFGSRVHRIFGYGMAILLYLTIGPFFALPRTATVLYWQSRCLCCFILWRRHSSFLRFLNL